jgi:hypothetical protein
MMIQWYSFRSKSKTNTRHAQKITNSEDVLEVTGDYTGGIEGFGASYEHLDHRYTHYYYYRGSNNNLGNKDEQYKKRRYPEA